MAGSNRVVVTGLGVVSCLGLDYPAVVDSLRAGRSGLRAMPEWENFGLKSLVAGTLEGVEAKAESSDISKKLRNGMTDAALYCSVAALDAAADAGLDERDLGTRNIGCLVGSSTISGHAVHEASALTFAGKARRVSPYTCYRSMCSGTSASVASLIGVHGRSYSISSACATSTHNIGHAYELIGAGLMDGAFAGGGEDINELISSTFQALRIALSTKYNDTPRQASRPYDADRDGFVLSGGGGIVFLENREQALARGAQIRAEIVGFGANSDGFGLVLPDPEGHYAAACIESALTDAGLGAEAVDYVNTHGTATLAGDAAEVAGMRKVFGSDMPPFSSTKSMAGHALGATGAHEVIYSVAMLEGGFMAPSINIETLDPEFGGLPIVTSTTEKRLETVLTTNFGFGGTNAALLLRSHHI